MIHSDLYLDVYAIVLALATLGSTTEVGSFLFLVAPPKVAKASTDMCRCRWHYHANL